jgi:2',3'-cyclic-nucleotide 2'-phosphodiesterase/3'-nucleotidase/5'-nucleotidase
MGRSIERLFFLKNKLGRTDLEAFYDYLVKTFNGGTITAAIEGRITNLNVAP